MKQLLLESYAATQKKTGLDPSKPGKTRMVFADDDMYNYYVESLSEGLDKASLPGFRMLAEASRRYVLENSMYGLNPYETLALPMLRVFYPKTIAKDLVTLIPMNKPEMIRPFIRASFTKYGSATQYSAPSINTNISQGPTMGIPVSQAVACPSTTDILAIAGLTSDVTHVEKSFKIVSVSDSTGSVTVDIRPTIDGEFSESVNLASGDDVITGRINYETGILDVASVEGLVQIIGFQATLSLEENTINPKVKLSIEKLQLRATDNEISTEWSVQMEQDLKALYDTEVQAEFTSVMGQQVILDIDRDIVMSLIATAETLAGVGHTANFDVVPPAGYTWGPKMWHENIVPSLTKLSARIYTDTNIANGNTLACNPLDASILENTNNFKYDGTSSENGDIVVEKATMGNGKWRVLVSSVVPQGKILMAYKPVEEIKAVYLFCPYGGPLLTPYPLGNKPSLTLLQRSAKQLIRPQGVAVLNILNNG